MFSVALDELLPGDYTLAVTDGENDLTADVRVGPRDTITRAFVFRYGTVYLASVPAGATVIRKGKEIGRTPMTLERVPTEPTTIQFRLDGYVSTNFPTVALAGQKTNYTVKLFSDRFATAMEEASRSLYENQFEDAGKSIAIALQIDAANLGALALQTKINQKAENWKRQELIAENLAAETRDKQLAVELESIPVLNPEDIIRICWNTNKKSTGTSTSASSSGEQFSKLNTPEAARQNPLATPVWIATDAIVKTIEGTAWSVKKLASIGKSRSQSPVMTRFDYVRLNPYLRAKYRYYGEIAKKDEKMLYVTFTTAGNSKQSYEVTARYTGPIPVDVASKPLGTPVWVSGTFIWLEDVSNENLSAANRFILDDCVIYPASTLPPQK